MGQHVSLWEASNQSISEYCVDKDFTVYKLNYWRYKTPKEQKVKACCTCRLHAGSTRSISISELILLSCPFSITKQFFESK